MAPLPYYVPPLTHEQLKRTVKAHIVRGLSYWLNTLDEKQAHPLNVLYLHGIHTQVVMHRNKPVEAGHALHVVKQFIEDCEPWVNPARVDTLMWTLSILQRYTNDQQDFEAVLAKAYFYHHCVYPHLLDKVFDMKEDDASKIPADIYSRLNSTLADLNTTLLAKDPMMPQHLRNIHGLVISYPEAVHLLKDDEIALIIGAAQEHTKTQIVSESAKKATVSKSKSLKNVSVSDL